MVRTGRYVNRETDLRLSLPGAGGR